MPETVKSYDTHGFATLLKPAKLDQQRDRYKKSNLVPADNWAIVTEWKEDRRHRRNSRI